MNDFWGIAELYDYGFYAKGILVTIYAIFIFRVNSSRIFGNHSALDLIINIILGAILGEVVVNNTPFVPALIVCSLIVFLHRLMTLACFKSHKIGKFIKGQKVCVISNGHYNKKNLARCHLTPHDILQALRIQHGESTVSTIKKALLERSGEISFIFKEGYTR